MREIIGSETEKNTFHLFFQNSIFTAWKVDLFNYIYPVFQEITIPIIIKNTKGINTKLPMYSRTSLDSLLDTINQSIIIN